MSERDILNPHSSWNSDIQDNPCPDYGFQRAWQDTGLQAKAPGGTPFFRETTNDGHTFKVSWLNRSYACAQRIAQFAHRYRRSYFTLIDQDGGGRHYVGRFEGELPRVQQGNLSYSLQDLTFVEYPGAPMLKYPTDWQRDGFFLDAVECTGQQNLATSGAWTVGSYDPDAGDDSEPGLTTMDNAGNVGDFATMEYRGYGVKLLLLTGPGYGQAEVFLDGVSQGTVNCKADAELAVRGLDPRGRVARAAPRQGRRDQRQDPLRATGGDAVKSLRRQIVLHLLNLRFAWSQSQYLTCSHHRLHGVSLYADPNLCPVLLSREVRVFDSQTAVSSQFNHCRSPKEARHFLLVSDRKVAAVIKDRSIFIQKSPAHSDRRTRSNVLEREQRGAVIASSSAATKNGRIDASLCAIVALRIFRVSNA